MNAKETIIEFTWKDYTTKYVVNYPTVDVTGGFRRIVGSVVAIELGEEISISDLDDLMAGEEVTINHVKINRLSDKFVNGPLWRIQKM